MLRKKPLILEERKLDYKYSKILIPKYFDIQVVTTFKFIKLCLSLNKIEFTFYHIRYFRWRGPVLTFPLYFLTTTLCHLRGIPIIFTCHNIYEHTFSSKRYSAFLRNYVCQRAQAIFILHSSQKKYLGRFQAKIHIIGFGDFKPFYKYHHEANNEFSALLKNWQVNNEIDLIFIGQHTRYKNIGRAVSIIDKFKKYYSLFISVDYPERLQTPFTLIYNKPVFSEIHTLLHSNRTIGLILLDNVSVSTTGYVYLNYKIPIIAKAGTPMGEVIEQYQVGTTFENIEELPSIIDRVKEEYSTYSQNTIIFCNDHTWEHSTQVHLDALSILDC